jgi:hypothetical protein
MGMIRKTDPNGLPAPQMMARKRFRRYTRFKPSPCDCSKPVKEKHEQVMGKLIRALRRYEAVDKSMGDAEFEDWTSVATGLVENISYSDGDIESFSLLCSELEIRGIFTLGRFLSALVNNSDSEFHNLHTVENEGMPMSGFTLWSPKKVFIEGDVGYIGEHMSDGRIMVSGNASNIGYGMSGGSILIDGDVVPGDNIDVGIGEHKTGGEIAVNGKIEDPDFHRYLQRYKSGLSWKILRIWDYSVDR